MIFPRFLSNDHNTLLGAVVSLSTGLDRALLLVLAFLLLLTTGCTPQDGFRQYASAVGPDLYSRQTVRNTELLAAYTTNLCRQADLTYSSSGSCQINSVSQWKTFVDMGLYDIDQRCDAFLDSLYYKEKTNDSILAQISDTRSLATTVLDATSTSRAAIRIVAAAFDFSENSFRNVNSTLLEALDPTTVKSIVFRRQQDIKQQIYAVTITNKPQALHALRTYLRVCMPFAIEMEANAVLTTVQRTNTDGDSPIAFADKPRTADDTPKRQPRPNLGKAGNDQGVIDLFGRDSGRTVDSVKKVQAKLCVPTTGKVQAQTRTAVTIYRQTKVAGDVAWRSLSQDEAKEILGPNVPICQNQYFLNYYETSTLASKQNFQDFVNAFNSKAVEI
ncbi:hypothetical protein ACU4I5_26965 (plasmid) [Ensifer adhaerens]